MEQLAESVKTHQKEIERLECVVGEKSEDISILSKRIEEKQRENEELAASFSTKIEELISTVSSKDQEIGDLTEKVEKLDAQNKSKQGTIMNHVKKIKALLKELEELKEQLNKGNAVLSNEKVASTTSEKAGNKRCCRRRNR